MSEIERFVRGFQRFRRQYFDHQPELFRELKEGQHPGTLLIGCCDSRTDPAHLLGCDPGDIFTVRNVANLVPPCDPKQHFAGVSSAIQFAVQQLKVQRIIVMGHARCGGIRALVERRFSGEDPLDYIGRWIRIAQPALDKVEVQLPSASEDERRQACELASILVSLKNLETYPWIQEALSAGQLTLHGWYFDLDRGALMAYSPRADAFLPMVDQA